MVHDSITKNPYDDIDNRSSNKIHTSIISGIYDTNINELNNN